MSETTLTTAQQQLLRSLGDLVPPERIERLWIFTAHAGKSRESGLFVAALLPDAGTDLRPLLTIRYAADPVKDGVRLETEVTEEGRAPPERIEQILAGVLSRAGDQAGELSDAWVEGRRDRWDALVARLAPGA